MFENRLRTSELIDEPDCPPRTVRQSHAFMRFVNRCFGGTAAVKQFVESAAANQPAGRPLRILDIGSGSCDIPLQILRWASARGIDLAYTCVERTASALPSECTAVGLPIQFVNADIFDCEPEQEFDYATASMFLHHLDAEQIRRLLEHLMRFVRKGVFINDLHRSVLTYLSCLCISPFLAAEVRHDALTSIRKGFRIDDLTALLAVPDTTLTVKTRPWGRITALIEFQGKVQI